MMMKLISILLTCNYLVLAIGQYCSWGGVDYDFLCNNGYSCVNGECAKSCRYHSDCMAAHSKCEKVDESCRGWCSLVCKNKALADEISLSSCSGDFDCDLGFSCDRTAPNGKCRPACEEDYECPLDYECNSGVCTAVATGENDYCGMDMVTSNDTPEYCNPSIEPSQPACPGGAVCRQHVHSGLSYCCKSKTESTPCQLYEPMNWYYCVDRNQVCDQTSPNGPECKTKCGTDLDCPLDYGCVQGLCILVTGTDAYYCGAGRELAFRNPVQQCSPTSSVNECGVGNICHQASNGRGFCCKPQRQPSGCPSGDDLDCPLDSVCDKTSLSCQPVCFESTQCSFDEFCGVNNICQSDSSVTRCTTDVDCPLDTQCNSGQCTPVTTDQCSRDSDCSLDNYCSGGICRYVYAMIQDPKMKNKYRDGE